MRVGRGDCPHQVYRLAHVRLGDGIKLKNGRSKWVLQWEAHAALKERDKGSTPRELALGAGASQQRQRYTRIVPSDYEGLI